MDGLPKIAAAGQLLAAGQLRATELVEYCLQRIDEFESRVHAWVSVDRDGALQRAAELDETMQTDGPVGPLHGIPVGIKDIIDVAGWPTRAGSKLMENHLATADAPAVQRLRAAGAIILGKTVTTEFACFDPPVTRNPWNLQHTPGGSSSGSAAAIATEMCLAALGSQTGGSITRPASFCGVAGLKPTFGWTDMSGIVPVSSRLDHLGPIARTADDLAAVYGVLAGQPIALPKTAPPALHLIESYFLETADDSVRQATLAAWKKLTDAGAADLRLDLPPSFGPVHAMHRAIMAVDAAETHCETFLANKDQYGPKVAELIKEGLNTFAVEYALALRHYEQFRADMRRIIRDEVIAVTPATVTPAPADTGTTGDPSFNSPWSYAGLPTVNIPCGLAENGMPCGLQLIGLDGSEERLLSVAAWCEAQLDFSMDGAIRRLRTA